MKKFINNPFDVEHEMIDGLIKANPETLLRVENENIVVRKNKKVNKVALITGGGSGHEPAHAGYVGYGMLDGAVAGNVYSSPSIFAITKGIKAVDAGKGTLVIIKNYTGDIINFNMAMEEVEDDGIKTLSVVVNDDVAVENSTWTAGRRGVAGTIFVHKIAGAKAEEGAELKEVQRVAQKTIDNVRTMGVAIAPCIIPASGIPGFKLEDNEMEVGIGIHGEPGVKKESLKPVNDIVDELLEHILKDIDYTNHEVAVLVNGCGGTPLMELYIAYSRVFDILANKGISIYKSFVGNYMTSLEMQGFSITLLRLDDELKKLLDAEANTPALKI